MTTAVQQTSRELITRTDFQRRAATDGQRAAMRGMWGRSHPDGGILVGVDVSLPEARSNGERWCERCKRVGRIMQWMEKTWFRCCGWPA